MSNHTTTFDAKTIKSLLGEMEYYRRGLGNLRKKLLQVLPEKFFSYGSDLWWEKSDEEAIESIKAGKGKKFKTYEAAAKYLTE